MRLEQSKEWWAARAEGDAVVDAGLLARDPVPDDQPANANAEENRIAFGRFINLERGQDAAIYP